MNYKLKIYKHSSIKELIDDDIAKIAPYFQSDFVKSIIPEGISISIDVEKTTIPMVEYPVKLLYPSIGKYDGIMYCFERGVFPVDGMASTLYNRTDIQSTHLSVDAVNDKADFTWKSMMHEITHQITFYLLAKNGMTYDPSKHNFLDNPIVNGVISSYYGNEQPYLVGGNYYQQLEIIKNLMKPRYLYFSEKEIVGLQPALVQMLDKARGLAGTPFKITSGYRDTAHNAEVGGVPNSSHTKGLAVDLAVITETRQNILRGLLTCGIPIFIEDCVGHIHVDIDSSIHKMGGMIASGDN